jgi:hypothetical protein
MKPIRNKMTAPAMTRQEWEELPAGVRYFLPYERMKNPETVKPCDPPSRARRVIVRAAKGRKQ